MRLAHLMLIALLLMPMTAKAIDAPAGQAILDAGNVLRGHFVETHQMAATAGPMHTNGRFVAVPSRGLIWTIDKPFPTSTVVTPQSVVQLLGGMAVKLPARNLAHIYRMVSGALAGNWSELEQDFVITPSVKGDHWTMLLTPRTDAPAKLPYATITVDGGHYVENIIMAKADSSYDAFSFSDVVLSSAPPAAQEVALFNQAGR